MASKAAHAGMKSAYPPFWLPQFARQRVGFLSSSMALSIPENADVIPIREMMVEHASTKEAIIATAKVNFPLIRVAISKVIKALNIA